MEIKNNKMRDDIRYSSLIELWRYHHRLATWIPLFVIAFALVVAFATIFKAHWSVFWGWLPLFFVGWILLTCALAVHRILSAMERIESAIGKIEGETWEDGFVSLVNPRGFHPPKAQLYLMVLLGCTILTCIVLLFLGVLGTVLLALGVLTASLVIWDSGRQNWRRPGE